MNQLLSFSKTVIVILGIVAVAVVVVAIEISFIFDLSKINIYELRLL